MEKIISISLEKQQSKNVENIANRLKMTYVGLGEISGELLLSELLTQGAQPGVDIGMDSPHESLLLINGLSDKRLDKLLFELRRAEVAVDYKAVLTMSNSSWTLDRLFSELRKEKAAYSK